MAIKKRVWLTGGYLDLAIVGESLPSREFMSADFAYQSGFGL